MSFGWKRTFNKAKNTVKNVITHPAALVGGLGTGQILDSFLNKKQAEGATSEELASYEKALSYAQKVAEAYGVTLTEDQLAKIGNTYGSGNFDEQKDFILASVNRYGAENYKNPAINHDQTSTVQNMFQNVFGRSATADEANYFAKELAQGKSAYELSQELQSLPEYQRVQAAKDRESLNTVLQADQQKVFERAMPKIISNYMKAGRLNSSGLNSALAQAQAELDQERQSALMKVGVSDNASIRDNAFGQFQVANAPYLAARDYYSTANTANNAWNSVGNSLNRSREIADYNRQASDYERYLQQQISGNKEAALYGIGGNLLNTALFAGMMA